MNSASWQISLLVAGLTALGPTGASAQDQCIEIQSDLVRLQCFDQWATENASPVLPPQEAFNALYALAARTGFLDLHSDFSFDMRMAQDRGTPCFFEVASSSVFRPNERRNVTVMYWHLDLREVQEVRRANRRMAEFVMNRDHNISLHTFRSVHLETAMPGPLVMNWAAERMAADPSLGRTNRSTKVKIVAEFEDYDESFDRIKDLVRSCQADADR